MSRRKTKPVPEEDVEDNDTIDTYNHLGEIETVLKNVVNPVEVVNNDVLLSRSASRYVPSLR